MEPLVKRFEREKNKTILKYDANSADETTLVTPSGKYLIF